MQRKKRVLVIFFTGGTIVSGFQGKGKKATGPNNRIFKSLYNYVEKFFQDKNIELICQEPLGMPGEDSSISLAGPGWI